MHLVCLAGYRFFRLSVFLLFTVTIDRKEQPRVLMRVNRVMVVVVPPLFCLNTAKIKCLPCTCDNSGPLANLFSRGV